MKVQLDFGQIAELDQGRIAAAFNKELGRVVEDCVRRPDNKTPRTVTLQVKVAPDGSDGVCDRTMIEFTTHSKLPPRTSRAYQTETDGKGKLLVNPESPDDIKQMTLDEAAAKPADPPAQPSKK